MILALKRSEILHEVWLGCGAGGFYTFDDTLGECGYVAIRRIKDDCDDGFGPVGMSEEVLVCSHFSGSGCICRV